jgi:hypothetical protein
MSGENWGAALAQSQALAMWERLNDAERRGVASGLMPMAVMEAARGSPSVAQAIGAALADLASRSIGFSDRK